MGFKINNASILLTGKIMQWNIWDRYIVWFWISKIGVVLAFRLTTINWISIQNIISKYHNRDGQDLWSETDQNTQLDVSYTFSSLLLVIPKRLKHQSVQSWWKVSLKSWEVFHAILSSQIYRIKNCFTLSWVYESCNFEQITHKPPRLKPNVVLLSSVKPTINHLFCFTF